MHGEVQWGCVALLWGCAAMLGAGGCGGAVGESSGPMVTQHITRDFGREPLAEEVHAPLEGHGTVLSLLKDYEDVGMSSSGRSVRAIDGLRLRELPETAGWVLNVNGIEADVIPRDYPLYEGNVVQWDYRDWESSLSVRATVGAFPETFARGAFGARFPTTVECADPAAEACRFVKRALNRAGVSPDGAISPGPRPPEGEVQRARLLVGPWKHWRGRSWPGRIDEGPAASGIFARFSRDAAKLSLLDWNGRAVREAGPGTGLVGAIRPTEADLLWVVTGVDVAGVDRAARALASDDLRDAFSAAVTEDRIEKLPLPPRWEPGPRG